MSEFDKDIKKDASEEASNRKKKLLGKILCVFFAIVLWVYVSYDKNPDTSRVYSNIPVSLAGIEVLEGRKLTVLTSDMYASVRLSGTRNTLSKVNKDDIKAIVNLSDITTIGEQKPIITITGIPDALSVEEKKIDSGKLVIDNLVQKNLDLNPDFAGEMDDSVVEGENTVFPEQITVKGPETILRNVTAWTEPIDISKVNKSENTFNSGVVLKDETGSIIKSDMIIVSDTLATVTLLCQGKKEIKVNAPEIVGSLDGYNITIERIEPETVVIIGDLEKVNLIDSVDTEVIDAYYATENMRCEIILPEEVTCETTKVNVKLKITAIVEDTVEEETAETEETAA